MLPRLVGLFRGRTELVSYACGDRGTQVLARSCSQLVIEAPGAIDTVFAVLLPPAAAALIVFLAMSVYPVLKPPP